jgi:hypothetical protein
MVAEKQATLSLLLISQSSDKVRDEPKRDSFSLDTAPFQDAVYILTPLK